MPDALICLDAGLVVRLVVDSADTRLLHQWRQWEAGGRIITAPALVYYEVANALYHYQKRRLLSPELVEAALATALALPIRLHIEADLHLPALRLAQRFDLPATYDAHYLALAEYLGAEFWTADRRLAQSVQSQLTWVHIYP